MIYPILPGQHRQPVEYPDTSAPVSHPTTAHACFDQIEHRADWTDTDWRQATYDMLESLQKTFPDISIVQGSASDSASLQALAQSLGSGKHLVLSPEWVEQMAQGPEAFEKGCQTLLHLLRSLRASDATGIYVGEKTATSWTYSPKSSAEERMEQAQKLLRWFAEMNAPKEEKKCPWLQEMPRNYSTKSKYARVARATSVSQVNLIISDIQGAINDLQGVAMSGSNKEAAQARRAIRSLRTLVMRATRKISYLQAEQLLKAKKKRAEQEQHQEKANMLRQLYSKQHRKRRRADQATATGGITQRPLPSRRCKNPYNNYLTSAVLSTPPLPEVSIPSGGGTGGGDVVLGPTIAL